MQKRPTISKSLLLTSASLYICSCIRIIQMYIYIYTVHCYRCPCTLKPTHTHTHTHTHLLWAAAKNIYDLFTCVQDSSFHVSVELFFEKRRACMRWQCFPGSFAFFLPQSLFSKCSFANILAYIYGVAICFNILFVMCALFTLLL